MTKKEALLKVLNGELEKVKGKNFHPQRHYVFVKNNELLVHTKGNETLYTNMQHLDEDEWEEYIDRWFENIPPEGVLVLHNSSVKRVVSYNIGKVHTDDNVEIDVTEVSLLTGDELITLLNATKKIS